MITFVLKCIYLQYTDLVKKKKKKVFFFTDVTGFGDVLFAT